MRAPGWKEEEQVRKVPPKIMTSYTDTTDTTIATNTNNNSDNINAPTSTHLQNFDATQAYMPWGNYGIWSDEERWRMEWKRIFELKMGNELNEVCNNCYRETTLVTPTLLVPEGDIPNRAQHVDMRRGARHGGMLSQKRMWVRKQMCLKCAYWTTQGVQTMWDLLPDLVLCE